MGRFNLIAVRVVSMSLLIFAFLSMGSFGNVRAADVGDEIRPPNAPPTAKAASQFAPLALPAPTPIGQPARHRLFYPECGLVPK